MDLYTGYPKDKPSQSVVQQKLKYVTDECVKGLLRLKYTIEDMKTSYIYAPTNKPVQIYNDNTACVCWSKSTTTKCLRHISIRDNTIRESVADKASSIKFIQGKINLTDIFTKELKDNSLFITKRDHITSIALNPISNHTQVRERGYLYIRRYASILK